MTVNWILTPATGTMDVLCMAFSCWYSPFTMGLEWLYPNIDLKIVQTIVLAKHFNLEAISKCVFFARFRFIKHVLK